MNPNCPYCQNPARYDLLPATELSTVTVRYERDPDTNYHRQRRQPVQIVGHLSRHPIRDQADFHIPCGNDSEGRRQ